MNEIGSFFGYERPDGNVGIRNLLVVLPVGQCANELAIRCADGISGAFPLLHTQPCAHLGEDNIAASRCLVGVGGNANAAAVLVVGIGCDALDAADVAGRIAVSGKPVECLTVESSGGWERVIERGRTWLEAQRSEMQQQERVRADLSCLRLGVKCGGSDASSAVAGNPAIGKVVDRWLDGGGTVIFSETTELIGAEHLLAARASSDQVAGAILSVVGETEARIRATGVDPRGTQPTPGNIAGGLTTLEEKSLGGVLKTGTRPIDGVFAWGEGPHGKGLHLMDCPANVPQLLLGWAAAGAELLVFSVGGGLPAKIPSLIGTNVGGLPLLPVIKVLSNPTDVEARGFFDLYAGGILEGRETLDEVADRLASRLLETASGRATYLEGYAAPGIQVWEMLVRGPTV